MKIKTMTLRLPVEQAIELEAIARVDDITVSDAVRHAITDHVERRRNDSEFRERLRRFMDEEREVLERLAQ
jgi:class 3 adenylate cyclase